MARTFPFTIRQVAKLLDLKIRYDKHSNGNMDVDCPFCEKESKMNLNAPDNVYRCNHCGKNGGMVQLYARIYGISNSNAYREICEILGCGKNSSIGANGEGSADMQGNSSKAAVRADSSTIHQTYSMLLSLLNLANPHKEHLLSRGFTESHIVEAKYKSTPAFGQQSLCSKLLQSGCVLEGVPGFYRNNGEWNVKLKAPGILIPVSGIDGRIAGIQIRLDKPVNGRKYIWVSSNDMEGGTSSGSPVHFMGDPAAKQVYVTDGSLKGAIAHALTHHTFICLPGVKSLSGLDGLLAHLKANGTTHALEAFNLNKLTDNDAMESATKLREKLSAYGFKVTSAVWGDKSLNSVADYFMHRMKKERNHVYNVDISAAVVV